MAAAALIGWGRGEQRGSSKVVVGGAATASERSIEQSVGVRILTRLTFMVYVGGKYI